MDSRAVEEEGVISFRFVEEDGSFVVVVFVVVVVVVVFFGIYSLFFFFWEKLKSGENFISMSRTSACAGRRGRAR